VPGTIAVREEGLTGRLLRLLNLLLSGIWRKGLEALVLLNDLLGSIS
jgi:hypothetical protein